MKILVTGAAGFIGSHMAERLVAHGHEVIGIDNFSAYYSVALKKENEKALAAQGIPIIHADLADCNPETLAGTGFHYIFHFAAQPGISAQTGLHDYLRNNIYATQNLLEFALKNKALKLFVNISTSSVYGVNACGREDTVPEPASFYGVTKLAAEQLALKYARSGDMNVCSLRLYSVYGPRERPDKLYTKLIDAAINETLFPLFEGSEEHIRSFTFVGDIVDGIISVIGKEKAVNNQVINLGNETGYTTKYGIACIKELLQKEIQFIMQPRRSGDQLHTTADITKAAAILNYTPSTSLMDGLRQQVSWQLTGREDT